jgi:hypothetical protein
MVPLRVTDIAAIGKSPNLRMQDEIEDLISFG